VKEQSFFALRILIHFANIVHAAQSLQEGMVIKYEKE